MTDIAWVRRSLLLLAAFSSTTALAADEAMPGKVTIVRPGRLTKFLSRPATGDVFALPGALSDPTVGGGELRFFQGDGARVFELPVQPPPRGWKGLGSPPGSKGYKYKGAGTTSDPCKVVLIKDRVVKAVCRGDNATIAPPLSGALGVLLTVGTVPQRYLAVFGGDDVKNTASLLKRKNAPPPPPCNCGDGSPSEFSFANGVGAGVCGTVTDGVTTKNLDCGNLVIGGGNSPVPASVFQDMVNPARFQVDLCTGKDLLLRETTQAMTGSLRQCTAPGCLFGPPLPIVLPSIPQSACVYLIVTEGGTGTAQCDTGAVSIDMEIHGEMFLTGDILPFRCSGGSNVGNRCLPPNEAVDCPGGSCVADPDVQPCPICNPSTLVCNGGPQSGMACAPGAVQVVGAPFPTSHDCKVNPALKLGDIPIPFHLSTGTTVRTAFASSSQERIFCGFCRDADDTLGFEEVTPAHPRPCVSDAECQQPYESCAQRNNGAFGPNGGGFTTITVIGSQAGNLEDNAPHTGTLSGVFCIAPTFLPLIDASSDLPGPGSVSLPSVIQLASPGGAFIEPTALP